MIPNDLLRVTFSYLYWRKYYDLCKLFDIDLKLSYYFSCVEQIPNPGMIMYTYPTKYHEVIGFLYKKDIPISYTDILSSNRVETIEYMYSIGYKCDTEFLLSACFPCFYPQAIKYLLSIGVPFCKDILKRAARYRNQVDFVKYLYRKYDIQYENDLMRIACNSENNELIIFLHSINKNPKYDETMLISACSSYNVETVKLIHSLGTPVTKEVIEYMEQSIYYDFGNVSKNKKQVMDFLESVPLIDSDDENYDIFGTS